MSYYAMIHPRGSVDWTTDRQRACVHVISFGPFSIKGRRAAEAKCRLMHDGTYAVPGMPEAETDDEAISALFKFNEWAKWPQMEGAA